MVCLMRADRLLIAFLVTALVWSSIIGCGKDEPTEPESPGGVIVPMAVGNRWDYQVSHYPAGGNPYQTDDSIVIVGQVNVGGEARYVANANEHFVNRGSGLWYKPSGTSTIYLLFAYPTDIGAVWPSGLQGEVAVTLLSKTSQVTVPHGSYSCYRYLAEYPVSSGQGLRYYYVVPNVGIVQYQIWDSAGINLEELGQLADVQLE